VKLAFVVQRYGREVNGGAEVHCRALAERMAGAGHDTTVLTTCARDYHSWANAYPAGVEQIGGVRVERHPVAFPRLDRAQHALGKLHSLRLAALERAWLVAQGPYSPRLLRRLGELARACDAFVLFTYLYHPTVAGLGVVGHKSVLVPTAHDEPALHMGIMRDTFRLPGAIAFNTEEERELVAALVPLGDKPCDVVGCGIDEPAGAGARPPLGRERPFILYLGRIERGKGVAELWAGFRELQARGGRDVALVLAGRGDDDIVPAGDDIVKLGFVSDAEKQWLLAHAEVVVIPSRLESLSLVLLEAWSHARPVLVNGECAVTRGHVRRAGGGACYRGAAELAARLGQLLDDPAARRAQGERGRAYVDARYRWPAVEARLSALLEHVRSRGW
jgi:glycosyltransferase involved in cell wall biosynthesis